MPQTARFHDILRRLAIFDEEFIGEKVGLRLGLPEALVLDGKTAALVQVAALVAVGSPAVGLEWSTTRALAAGATEDELVDVLLAIAPLAGLCRVVAVMPDIGAALGYDIEAALEDCGDS